MFRKLHDAGTRVTVEIDGVAVPAELGEPVAAVLLRQSAGWSRLDPVRGERRAPFCMMGVCFDCLAEVDGVSGVQTCLAPVRDGMVIARQVGTRDISR